MNKFLTMELSLRVFVGVSALAVLIAAGSVAYATHSWGPYHWARTANPFTLKLGDNVSAAWDAHLASVSSDWSQSSALDTAIVAGNAGNPKRCRATSGRVEVCSASYGFNGWLGIAQIWIDANSHIAQGVSKMNDTYFNTATYNKPSWRQFVMCQEVGHTFGLAHQDENFSNPNLGTCMDYTSDPDGTVNGQLSNLHPNTHDYDQLVLKYEHLDSYTSALTSAPNGRGKSGRLAPGADISDQGEWGQVLKRDGKGRPSLHGRDLGNGEKVFTFVFWANGDSE